MRFRDIMSFTLVVVAMAASAEAAFAQQRICDDSSAIIPGQAIGKLALGSSVDSALQLLGKPEVEPSGKVGTSEWQELIYQANDPPSDFNVYVENGKIVALGLGAGSDDTAKCSTSEGVHIGGNMSDKVRTAFGEPDGKDDHGLFTVWVYDKRGVELFATPQGDVLAIIVYAPGTFCITQQAVPTLLSAGTCADFSPPLH